MLDSEPEGTGEGMRGDLGVAALSTNCFNLKGWRSLTTHYCICSHLPVKGSGTRRIMSIVLVALAPAHGTKGVINSADGHHSVYGQIHKEWDKIESGILEINTY